MTDKAVKVGDVVAWDDMPTGAMVRLNVDSLFWFGVRLLGRGCWVGHVGSDVWRPCYAAWSWHRRPITAVGDAVLVALGLTGNETADELRALAEAFERDHPAA
jgi:hypothetical protein